MEAAPWIQRLDMQGNLLGNSAGWDRSRAISAAKVQFMALSHTYICLGRVENGCQVSLFFTTCPWGLFRNTEDHLIKYQGFFPLREHLLAPRGGICATGACNWLPSLIPHPRHPGHHVHLSSKEPNRPPPPYALRLRSYKKKKGD